MEIDPIHNRILKCVYPYRCGCIRMIVAPLTASPARIARGTGAAPLQRGSRLACTFRIPLGTVQRTERNENLADKIVNRGIGDDLHKTHHGKLSISSAGIKWPNEATTPRSKPWSASRAKGQLLTLRFCLTAARPTSDFLGCFVTTSNRFTRFLYDKH